MKVSTSWTRKKKKKKDKGSKEGKKERKGNKEKKKYKQKTTITIDFSSNILYSGWKESILEFTWTWMSSNYWSLNCIRNIYDLKTLRKL